MKLKLRKLFVGHRLIGTVVGLSLGWYAAGLVSLDGLSRSFAQTAEHQLAIPSPEEAAAAVEEAQAAAAAAAEVAAEQADHMVAEPAESKPAATEQAVHDHAEPSADGDHVDRTHAEHVEHAEDHVAKPGHEADGDHGDHGGHAAAGDAHHENLAQDLVPGVENAGWFKVALKIGVTLVGLGVVMGLLKRRFHLVDPGMAAAEQDKAAHGHGHDDHGHDDHGHDDGHGHDDHGHGGHSHKH